GGQIRAGGLESGGETEEGRGAESGGEGEEEHAAADPHFVETRDVRRTGGEKHAQAGPGEQETDGCGDEREERALGEELADQAAAVGAKGGAERGLLLPRLGAGEEQ